MSGYSKDLKLRMLATVDLREMLGKEGIGTFSASDFLSANTPFRRHHVRSRWSAAEFGRVEEGTPLLQTLEGRAKGAHRKIAVAAYPLARRLLENEDTPYALPGCQRRREGCVARSHHRNVVSVYHNTSCY
jgi:hypothetical protein